MAWLVSQLPTSCEMTPQVVEYLLVLDRVLEDRRITQNEAAVLAETASALGLLKEQVLFAHDDFLGNLLQIALADGDLTDAERLDLNQVAELLEIDRSKYENLLETALATRESFGDSGHEVKDAEELRGRTVCFTGTFVSTILGVPISREQGEEAARSLGMEVVQSVTKRLNYLIAADPDSLSTKAKKARRYGIPIISEPISWKLAGVQTDH